MTALTIEVADSLDAIDSAAWDDVFGATGSSHLSHGWLRYVEREPGGHAVYLLATAADGSLHGALPTYAVDAESNRAYASADASTGSPIERYLVAGTRWAYVNDVLLQPNLDQGRGDEALGALVRAAEHRAATLGRDGVALLYLHTQAAQRLCSIRPDARPVLLDIESDLPLAGDGFDGYLAGLSAHRTYSVRKELRRFNGAGYRVAVERLSDCWHDAGPLVSQVQRKYGHPDSPAECRTRLRRLADVLDPQSLVFTARLHDELVGCAVYLAGRGTLHGRSVGFAYDRLAGVGEYFALYVYEPIRYAYRHGYTRLELGRGSNVAKVRRGARPQALWAILLPAHHTTGAWRQLNRDALVRIREEVPVDGLSIPDSWITDDTAPPGLAPVRWTR